ncbi:unnamed protein product [Bemisia tabaci]|uniref:Uncharacterized protein n=1 Tax=Bemisia tabaci TaxID=7038 RepID=A0A9P0A6E0_BEMTA|nr:unnamed protein product [Bemisia tabaci]
MGGVAIKSSCIIDEDSAGSFVAEGSKTLILWARCVTWTLQSILVCRTESLSGASFLVRPLHEAYQAALTAHLTEAMNTFWAECYESSKLSSHKRNREVGESKLRFQMNVVSPCRSRASEESLRFANVLTQQRNAELAVRRKWRVLKEFLCGPRGAWKSSNLPQNKRDNSSPIFAPPMIKSDLPVFTTRPSSSF